jgi:formylglycine-generating enzyme required for sulfatase activity
MAGRHALLIGISAYGEGLSPIPSALRDVDAMKQVLLDPKLGGIPEERLQVLTNSGRMEMESAIENFYANKDRDDLLLLYFSGHGFRQDDRQLLLSTSQSRTVSREGRTSVQRPTTLSALDVRAYMDRSRSRRQVVILDCCFSGAFAVGMAVRKDEGGLALEDWLGGKGRAVLTSSDAIETSQAAGEGEGLSVYTRCLLEGILTGAADGEGRGWLSPRDLHRYAAQRVAELAPTMTPQFIHTEDGDLIRVCRVHREPSVVYRHKVQELLEKQAGVITAAGRAILDDLRQEIDLALDGAERIEVDVWQEFRDYGAKLARYRATVAATLDARGNQVEHLTAGDREELLELAQRLTLRTADRLAIQQELGIHQVESPPQQRQRSSTPMVGVEVPLSPQPENKPASGPSQGSSPVPLPITRGWLVREGEAWRLKEESIMVTAYRDLLAEGVAITMVELPGGNFLMGSPDDEAERSADEGPQHRVRLGSFFIGQTPVTWAQWQVVAGWAPLERELALDPAGCKGSQYPVEGVLWEEAMEFCRRLSHRSHRTYTLPSEAQWEYACRAGTTTPFAFGETLTSELANFAGHCQDGSQTQGVSRQEVTDVARFPANAWGLHDMHGTVWEWCLDSWHGSYRRAPIDGSCWLAGDEQRRVLRGGSWVNGPETCRSAYRNWSPPDVRNSGVGFRVVCSP